MIVRVRAAVRIPRRVRVAAFAALLAGGVPSAGAAEFGDWFTTPERRAAERLAAEEHEALIEEAPDAYWEGIGRYGAGDAEGAAEAFARALGEGGADADGAEAGGVAAGGADASLSADERDALLYNRATAATRAGRPAEALPLFDELLERDPTNADALHNRDIARRLAELDERESGEGQGGSEGENEEGEAGDGESEGDEREGEGSAGSGEESASNETGENEDGRNGEDENGAGEASGDGTGEREAGEGDASDDADAAARAERRAEAEAALEAERRAAAAGDGDGTGEAAGAVPASAGETPTEREQATEQWLRRIPDDPAGLLRRRLERSHRMDYPEVQDGDRPW